jgi:hypothetical protein
MYISLLQGTKTPNRKIKGQGETGPVIGPVQISWTYDRVKLHDPCWDDFEDLTISKVGDRKFLHFDGSYYLEFKIWNNNHPSVEQERKKGRPFLTWTEFLERTERPKEHIRSYYDTDPEDELKDTNYNHMYINFFHGRKNPKAEMEGWGDHGPILGPVNISWIHGKFRLYNPQGHVFYHLLSKDGLIPIKDYMFYGDFEVLNPKNPLIEKNQDETPFLNWKQFRKQIA